MSASPIPATEVRGRRLLLGTVDQIGVGQGRCFRVEGRRIAVFRARCGSLYALDASCPHRGGPLADGIVGAETVVCPFHGYKFSLIDGHGIDSEFSVESYPLEMESGEIFIRLR